jgi:hypothetical protein
MALGELWQKVEGIHWMDILGSFIVGCFIFISLKVIMTRITLLVPGVYFPCVPGFLDFILVWQNYWK